MNISLADIAKQFLRAKRLGWLAHFKEAAEGVSFVLDVADLMAIASRETNLDPRWLTTAGDRGNGYGLLQADKRYFPEWVKSGKWRDAREGVLKGAEVLANKWNDLQNCIGNKRGVPSSKTGKMSFFVGKAVSGADAKRILIASYNCGRWAHYAASNDQDIDRYSTGKDYSKDVIERAAAFRILIKKDSSAAVPVENQPIPKPDTQLAVSQPEHSSEQPPTKPLISKLSNLTTWVQGVIERVSSFEGSFSKSRWTATIVKDAGGPLILILSAIGRYWYVFVAGLVLISAVAWFLRRTEK